jgi:hypothetical protein
MSQPLPLDLLKLARQGIEFSEVVENGATNSMFGEGIELAAMFRPEAVDGLNEANGASRDQVIKFYLPGKMAMDFECDEAHLRKVIENGLLAIECR